MNKEELDRIRKEFPETKDLTDFELETWVACNWCFADSCYSCPHRQLASKKGWW